jgi:hypothetical protein
VLHVPQPESTSINQNVAWGVKEAEISSCTMNVKKKVVFGLLCFLGRQQGTFLLFPHLCRGRRGKPQGVAIVNVFMGRARR